MNTNDSLENERAAHLDDNDSACGAPPKVPTYFLSVSPFALEFLEKTQNPISIKFRFLHTCMTTLVPLYLL